MADTIACPNCKRMLHVSAEHLSQTVQCPECQTTFVPAQVLPPLEARPEQIRSGRDEPPAPPHFDDRYDDRYGDRHDRDRDYDERFERRYVPHRGSTVLVLGILGLVVCGGLGIPAWVMGNADLKEMSAGRMDSEGRGLTNAGYICGIIGTILFAIQMVVGAIVLMVLANAPRRF